MEEMPEFPGGEAALNQYIANTINYPESAKKNGIQGRVYVTFRISKEGKVSDAKVARSIYPALDEEAVRVVGSLPNWKPGKQNGQPVEVAGLGIPVDFELEDYTPKVQSVASNLIVPGTLYIVDGKETTSIKDIPQDDIEKINVLNRASSAAIYGEKGKDGVIIIQTKNGKQKSLQGKINNSNLESNQNVSSMRLRSPSGSEFPLFILDGKEVPNLDDVSHENIEKIDVLKGESATGLFGEKGKNGVIVITSKQKAETNTITSELELRQFIAKNIKYPVEAQKNNVQGTVDIWAVIEHDGKITFFYEKRPAVNIVPIDEVVVVAYSTKKKKTGNEGTKVEETPTETGNSDSSALFSLLKEEVKRVAKTSPTIEMPELKGKTVRLRVKFELQE
ncbi:MAG: TonB family protein [Mariniphaga sp.]|nr:TonB family protein [Mariniphaga sp.]